MVALDAMHRAREALLRRVGRSAAPVEAGDLVAIAEAAGGLCPRRGRALIGVLVRVGLLARVEPAGVVRGRRWVRQETGD